MKIMTEAEKYVLIIMQDDVSQIIAETPTVYEAARIERLYEFADGAVVKYEWQDVSLAAFNHRFTLVKPPVSNPDNIEPGLIHTINY